MRAKGNGDINVCANNLLRTFRGEVPFERVKGIDARLIDRPANEADAELKQDAEWLLETYEPRAIVNGIEIEHTEGVNGDFAIRANITEREE